MNRTAIAFLLSLGLSACATTEPYGAAGIDYRLPRTDAAVAASYTLTSCDDFSVDADVSLAPQAGAQEAVYHLSGRDLASARIKRDVKISLTEDGVIAAVNASNEDKTPEIIGNVIKTVGALAPVVLGTPLRDRDGQGTAPRLHCKQEVADALSRSKWLGGEIRRLRASLVAQPSNSSLVKALNRAAKERAALKDGILKVDTTGSIELNPGTSAGAVEIDDWTPFTKWFDAPADSNQLGAALIDNYGLSWTARLAEAPPQIAQPQLPAPKSVRPCHFAMAVPAVAVVDVDVKKYGSALPDGLEVKKSISAAQWADPEKLCLDVGFGESRTVALNFDKYGRTTEFGWGSEATAATVSGAIAGYASDVAGIATALQGRKLAKMKAEIDEIETEQKLSELHKCKMVREAGGDCASGE